MLLRATKGLLRIPGVRLGGEVVAEAIEKGQKTGDKIKFDKQYKKFVEQEMLNTLNNVNAKQTLYGGLFGGLTPNVAKERK